VDGIPPEILQTRGSLKRDDMITFHAAAAFLPWKPWLFTGDPSILEQHYPLMKGFFDRFADEVENRMEKLRCWGDWCDNWMGDDPRRPPTPFLDNLPRGYEKIAAKIKANPTEPIDLGVFPINTSVALTSAARYDSKRGPISVEWKKKNNGLSLTVSVPWNTTATVKLPGLTKITVNGKPQEKSPFDLPAGQWEIVAKQNQNKEPK